jgi:hypothetical protein
MSSQKPTRYNLMSTFNRDIMNHKRKRHDKKEKICRKIYVKNYTLRTYKKIND